MRKIAKYVIPPTRRLRVAALHARAVASARTDWGARCCLLMTMKMTLSLKRVVSRHRCMHGNKVKGSQKDAMTARWVAAEQEGATTWGGCQQPELLAGGPKKGRQQG